MVPDKTTNNIAATNNHLISKTKYKNRSATEHIKVI